MWSNVSRSSLVVMLVAGVCAVWTPSCATTTAPPLSEDLSEDGTVASEGLSGSSTAVGTQLEAIANVNLRTSPSGSAKILHVVPDGSIVTLQASAPSNGYYKVKHDGSIGWSYGKYYEPVQSGGGGPTGTVMTATGDVNLRSGPSTSYQVLDVVVGGSQVKLVSAATQNGYYNIDFNGTVGWSSSKYYTSSGNGGGGSGGSGGGAVGGDPGGSGGAVGGGSGGGSAGGSAGSAGGSPVLDSAMARAAAGVGFSYWWGHGRFRSEGVNGNAGSCSGSCPSCSHSGSYGADCSGFVAKVWQVPSSNTDLASDSHPYSTADFDNDTSQWKTVSRSSLKAADALVYRSGGSGHIFIYSKGDGWGSMYAYECKGCSAGCVKGYRTATSGYHAIRRAGY
ncbi:MAG: SH3 domain-containing protein [Myxococcales bacterium]|nr:SH3 domain-containing protein [Myxococcales bacterium]